MPPRIDGYYWVLWPPDQSDPDISWQPAFYVEGEWWVFCLDHPLAENELIIGPMLKDQQPEFI